MAIRYVGERKPNPDKYHKTTYKSEYPKILYTIVVYGAIILIPSVTTVISFFTALGFAMSCFIAMGPCMTMSAFGNSVIVVLPILDVFISFWIAYSKANLSFISSIVLAVVSCAGAVFVPLGIPILIGYFIVLVLWTFEKSNVLV